MNSYTVSVEPKDFVTVNVAHSVEMRITNLQIGVSVDVTCLIKNQNGNIFKVEWRSSTDQCREKKCYRGLFQ